MNKEMLYEHLALAEAHVAQGLEHIAKQHRIIASLSAKGLETTSARELLAQLEDNQALHEAGRDRVQDELNRAGKGRAGRSCPKNPRPTRVSNSKGVERKEAQPARAKAPPHKRSPSVKRREAPKESESSQRGGARRRPEI